MSLYNALFGSNPLGQALVALVQQAHPTEIGRYRDAWVEAHGDDLLIRVHTRNGGGNRECWGCDDEPCTCGVPVANDQMQAHPWYVRDADDDYDPTYADFYFRPDLASIDPEIARSLVAMADAPVDVSARWSALIAGLSAGGES